MDWQQAAKVFGPNFISPQTFIDCLQAEFSEEEMRALENIPLSESDAESFDLYNRRKDIPVRVKDFYVLCPMPARLQMHGRSAPLNVYNLVKFFGFSQNPNKKIFFINNEKVDGWDTWFRNASGSKSHPVYQTGSASWFLIRKDAVPASLEKSLNVGRGLLSANDALPTLLEVLTAMFGYYFSIIDPQKTDEAVKMPRYFSRDWYARMLSGKMTYTQDLFSSGFVLIAGLNTPASGIYLEKLEAQKPSYVTGICPVRRLKN